MPPPAGNDQWFEDAFGFKEGKFNETRRRFAFDAASGVLESTDANGSSVLSTWHVGPFDTPSVAELRDRCEQLRPSIESLGLGHLHFENQSADTRGLLSHPDNAGAVFLAASQFNCLEMVGPRVRPEDGITKYALDGTQGPMCAMACPGATAFRNYCVNGKGQGGEHQLNLLKDVERVVENEKHGYWYVQNGYSLPKSEGSIARLSVRMGQDPELAAAVAALVRDGLGLAPRARSSSAPAEQGNPRQ